MQKAVCQGIHPLVQFPIGDPFFFEDQSSFFRKSIRASPDHVAHRHKTFSFLLRKSDPKDERITMLEITPKGRERLKDISREKDGNIARYLKHFFDEQKKEVLLLLRSVIRENDYF
jgi:hypothetical protein